MNCHLGMALISESCTIDLIITFMKRVKHINLIFVLACYDKNSSMDKWLSRQESSGWLSHVKDIINCACFVAQCIDKESEYIPSVLLFAS